MRRINDTGNNANLNQAVACDRWLGGPTFACRRRIVILVWFSTGLCRVAPIFPDTCPKDRYRRKQQDYRTEKQ